MLALRVANDFIQLDQAIGQGTGPIGGIGP
jgi:hypothetical protein